MRVLKTWKTCQNCGLRDYPRVYYRGSGSVPIDVLFVGEAPGEMEMIHGEPFLGRSGQLLQDVITSVNRQKGFSYRIVNSVICSPLLPRETWEEKGKPKFTAPTKEEADSCFFHLQDAVRMWSPRNIVALGKVAHGTLKRNGLDHYEVRHPAFILRKGGRNSVEFKKLILQLHEIVNA